MAEENEKGSEKHIARGARRARSLLYLVLVVALAFLLFFGLSSLLGTPFPLLVVKTGSMRPVIEIGDIIIVQGVSYDEIYASPIDGDVIVFYRPSPAGRGPLIVHRAIEKTPIGVITKGDANSAPDPWSPVPPQNIVGRWIGLKIPYWTGLGYLSLILRGEILRPLGLIVIVFIVMLNVIYIARDVAQKRRS